MRNLVRHTRNSSCPARPSFFLCQHQSLCRRFPIIPLAVQMGNFHLRACPSIMFPVSCRKSGGCCGMGHHPRSLSHSVVKHEHLPHLDVMGSDECQPPLSPEELGSRQFEVVGLGVVIYELTNVSVSPCCIKAQTPNVLERVGRLNNERPLAIPPVLLLELLKSIRAHLDPGSACVNCLYSCHILYLWHTANF